MAKVKGPLFSLDARGKIADTLVYMGWKGLKTVRQYVNPFKPKHSKPANSTRILWRCR